MAYLISHVQPLWSFAAPAGRQRYQDIARAQPSDAPRCDQSEWRWVIGDNGRLERRPASDTPR
jgi:hypothetical protein